MKSVLEFFSNLYWLSLPETVAQTFWHADWEGAYQRAGILGLLTEAGHSLLGTNTWPFFVPLDSSWSGADIQQLLSDHGVEMWGQDFANSELFFRVRKSKAAWAQYLLLREGVPLRHRLLAQESKRRPDSATGAGHTPRSSDGSLQEFDEQLEQQLDNVIDRIASALDL